MRDGVEERAVMLGEYIIENDATVRAAARQFHISKSTVHKDVSGRLQKINPQLYGQVRVVLNTNKANDIIHAHLFRPPHGWMRQSEYWWLHRTYKVIMWDVVTRDYSKWMTAEDVVNNVKKYARNGSIITFHDSLKSIDKLKTALPQSIEWLMEQGYEFKIFD